MKLSIYVLLIALIFICCENPNKTNPISTGEKSTEQLPYLTYQKEQLFPGDGSLLRAEDGVALADGRIIVVDQAAGLRLIEEDGTNRPFGNLAEVGFLHTPENNAGPNGIVLEHDGKHVLMCDVANGKIFRTNIATEKVELIYDHPYGVNAIYSDKTGAIWFTQCAKNTNMGEMFMEINLPGPHGAIFRMADLKSVPTKVADSLYFANGITMDESEENLFVSETMMDRVHAFEVDVNTGETKYSRVVASVGSPDNITFDNDGRLIVASPVNNQVVAVDFKNHSQHIIFDGSTNENQKITDEWFRRSHLGMERVALISPDLFSPLPGLLTGMFFSSDGETLYISNLGNDLLKLDYLKK
jgi:sugar lactone lactonase YvrE